MEQNNNPYEYEKPISQKKSNKLGLIAGLGLFGIGAAIGGSSATASLLNPAAPEATAKTEVVADSTLPTSDTAKDSTQVVEPASIAPAPAAQDATIAVPARKAETGKTSQINLPQLPAQSFGNTSSATPSAGGGSAPTGMRGEHHGGNEAHEAYEAHEDFESRDSDD